MTSMLEYAMSAANRLAVAAEAAERERIAAFFAREAARDTLSAIPGALAIAENRPFAERRLRDGHFPALAQYLAAEDRLAFATLRRETAGMALARYALMRRIADEGPQNLHRWESWPEGRADVSDAAYRGWIRTAKAEPWHENASLIVLTDFGRAALREIERGAE